MICLSDDISDSASLSQGTLPLVLYSSRHSSFWWATFQFLCTIQLSCHPMYGFPKLFLPFLVMISFFHPDTSSQGHRAVAPSRSSDTEVLFPIFCLFLCLLPHHLIIYSLRTFSSTVHFPDPGVSILRMGEENHKDANIYFTKLGKTY